MCDSLRECGSFAELALFRAVREEDWDEVTALIKAGVNVAQPVLNRVNCLVYAIKHDLEHLVKQLFLAKADRRYGAEDYRFLLDLAIDAGSYSGFRLVLQRMVYKSIQPLTDVSDRKSWGIIVVKNDHWTSLMFATVNAEFLQENACYAPLFNEADLMRAAFALMRERIAEVCIALQSLRLPALLTVMVLEESCEPPNTNLRMYDTWRVAALVKHFIK